MSRFRIVMNLRDRGLGCPASFGFMHGEAVGLAVTPTVAIAYAIVALFLFGLSRSPATFPAPLEEKAIAASPAE